MVLSQALGKNSCHLLGVCSVLQVWEVGDVIFALQVQKLGLWNVQ